MLLLDSVVVDSEHLTTYWQLLVHEVVLWTLDVDTYISTKQH